LLALAFATAGTRAQNKTTAERLGDPPDSKLLIVLADHLAVAHSVETASFNALNKKAITSASIMVPCAWLTEVTSYAKDHPDTDLGLHLTSPANGKRIAGGRRNQKTKSQASSIPPAICGGTLSPRPAI